MINQSDILDGEYVYSNVKNSPLEMTDSTESYIICRLTFLWCQLEVKSIYKERF